MHAHTNSSWLLLQRLAHTTQHAVRSQRRMVLYAHPARRAVRVAVGTVFAQRAMTARHQLTVGTTHEATDTHAGAGPTGARLRRLQHTRS